MAKAKSDRVRGADRRVKLVATAIALGLCAASCGPAQGTPPKGQDQVLLADDQLITVADQTPSSAGAPRCAAAPNDPPVGWCAPIRAGDSVQTQLERIAGCSAFAIVATAKEPEADQSLSAFVDGAVAAIESCGKGVPPGLAALRDRKGADRISIADGSAVRVKHELDDQWGVGTVSIWRFTAEGHAESVQKALTFSFGKPPEN
jgi:hypothetical protein